MENDPAIKGLAPELIPAAVYGDKRDVHRLLFSDSLDKLLYEVTACTSWKFGVDAEELRDYLFERIRRKIHKLTNKNNSPWPVCFSAWVYRMAERRALNVLRHRAVEERYWDGVCHDYTISIRGGQRQAELQSRTPSQEEELEAKERRALRSLLRQKVRDIYRSLEPDDAKLIWFWADKKDDGKWRTLRELSEATGMPLSTVSYRLKTPLQKAFVQKIEDVVVKALGAAQLPEDKELSAGIRDLVARSLKEMNERELASPRV